MTHTMTSNAAATYTGNLCNNAVTRADEISPQRIQACLHALSGIRDPEAWVKEVKELLTAIRFKHPFEIGQAAVFKINELLGD